MKTARFLLLAALACVLPPRAFAQDTSRFTVEAEAGPAWQTRNDVQIPNAAPATRFSLVDVAGKGPWIAGRVYLTWGINARHSLRLLAAPFSITETGTLGSAVTFAGATYQPGAPTTGTYTFNSYRLSYRYRFHRGARWTWWVGFTAKVRDAKIELQQGSTTSRKTDLGFVPLLHVSGDARVGRQWRLILDMDALAGGPGRAEDVAVKVGRDLGRHWTVAAGYRTVEGGAAVSSVYAFAWLHYAVLSVTHRF